MSIVQLNPPLPLNVQHQGEWQAALAHLLIDYGMESSLYWVVFLQASGECWTLPNELVRAQKNVSLQRHLDTVAPRSLAG